MITEWFLAHATTTTANVMVRSDTDGTLSWSGDGAAADVAVTSATDGWGCLTITGLSAGNTFSGSASIAGDSVAVRPRTMPANGGCIVWASCIRDQVDWTTAAEHMLAQNPDALVFIGDFFYPTSNASSWGVSCEMPDTVAKATSSATWSNWWRHAMRNPGFKRIAQTIPFYVIFDDHEVGGGDNWDHSLDQATTGESAITDATNQGHVNDAWAASIDAYDWIAQGNPTPGGGGVRKGSAVTADEGAYPVDNNYYTGRYFNFDVGDLRIYVLDCISNRDQLSDTDGFAKKMLANNQRGWLRDDLVASQAAANVILSPKKFYPNIGEAGDSFYAYTTERRIFLYEDVATTDKITVIGTGDRHEISAAYDERNGALHLNACPLTQKWVPGVDAGYNTFASNNENAKVIFKYYGGGEVAAPAWNQETAPGCFGVCRRGSAYTESNLVNSLTGDEMMQWQRIDDITGERSSPQIGGSL